jgi:Flp pilus assembly protein TadG
MVHNPVSRIGRRDDGAVAIITVILISAVFVGLAALVVDLGMARDSRRQAQNAADASALAAGNVLYGSDGTLNITGAINAAKDYARTNYDVTSWTGCPDPSALSYRPEAITYNNTCISFDSATAPTTVRVMVPIRDVSTPFAGIWGVSTVPVSAVAEIGFDTGGLAKCGLCVIGPGLPPNEHNLKVGTIFESGGADVAFNGPLVSNNAQAGITVSGGGNIDLQGSMPSNGTFSPTPKVTQPAIVDPLAELKMPDYRGLTVHANTNTCPAAPGIYDHLSDCGGIAMGRGLYVVTGSANINGNIVANGVTLYFVCGTYLAPRACNVGDSGGSLNFVGSNTLTITAPAAGEANQGLAIVADRNNTATLSFRGSQTTQNTGTIYAKSGTLNVNGDSTVVISDSLVVVGDVTFSGTVGVFKSTYTQEKNVTVPPSNMHLSQ